MADSKLLKEAIADARAVKETALKNAKQALEEAFTPKLQSMLSAKIQNESEVGTGDDYNFEEPTEDSPDYDFPDVKNEDNVPGDVDSEKHPHQIDGEGQSIDDLVEALNEEDDDEVEDVEDEVEDVEDELDDLEGEDEEDMDENVDMDMDMDDDGYSDEDEEDLDLESVIRELEEELNETDGYDGEEDGNFTDTDWSTDHDVADEIDEVYEVDLASLIREMEGEDDWEEDEEEEEMEEVFRLRRENSNLKESLQEHEDVVRFLKDKLTEVNLLNSKLLYTNKLFGTNRLTNEQKLKVIEQFDRASNLREVKLVYATLAESFKGVKKSDSGKKGRKSITEGLASKPVGSTKSEKSIMTEGNRQARRLQQLAGIRDAYEDK